MTHQQILYIVSANFVLYRWHTVKHLFCHCQLRWTQLTHQQTSYSIFSNFIWHRWYIDTPFCFVANRSRPVTHRQHCITLVSDSFNIHVGVIPISIIFFAVNCPTPLTHKHHILSISLSFNTGDTRTNILFYRCQLRSTPVTNQQILCRDVANRLPPVAQQETLYKGVVNFVLHHWHNNKHCIQSLSALVSTSDVPTNHV